MFETVGTLVAKLKAPARLCCFDAKKAVRDTSKVEIRIGPVHAHGPFALGDQVEGAGK